MPAGRAAGDPRPRRGRRRPTILTALLLQATARRPGGPPWAISLPPCSSPRSGSSTARPRGIGVRLRLRPGRRSRLGRTRPASSRCAGWASGCCAAWSPTGRACAATRVTAGLLGAVGRSVAALAAGAAPAAAARADAVRDLVPTAIGDALLAFPVLALVRRMLHTDALREPRTRLIRAGRG